MNIKWNERSVHELVNIVSYLKNNKIGEILENLGSFFIEKHSKYFNIDNYSMNLNDDNLKNLITNGEYKLAFICELSILYYRSFPNRKKRKRKFTGVYSGLSYMIRYCIYSKLKYHSHKLDYSEFYLISLLKDNLLPDVNIKNKKDPYLNILTFSLFLVTEIMKIEYNKPNIIYNLTSLISETQNLDLSILSVNTNRTILEILKTKRTLYVRFLLVLTYELIKIPDIMEPEWLLQKLNFINHEKFLSVISSPLIETIIFITSHKIN